MSRLIPFLGAAAAGCVLAGSAGAADLPQLRAGFPTSAWAGQADSDPLTFDAGLRYWYSMGAQSFEINSGLPGDHGKMEQNDTSQILEAHLRIEDHSTNTYLKGIAGMAVRIGGDATGNGGKTAISDGNIGYAGADLGYSVLDNGPLKFGPFIGYQYWNDSPNSYRDDYTTASSASDISYDPTTGQTSYPGASKPNNIDLHMLRLGISTKADLGPMIDFTGELAAVPYARVSGVLGAGSGAPQAGSFGSLGAVNVHNVQASPTTIDGWGYGAMAEAFIGLHPDDHWSFRVGGRAWYVQGTVDAKFARASIGDPSDSDPGNPPNYDTAPTFSKQGYITQANPFSLFRYGILAEVNYRF